MEGEETGGRRGASGFLGGEGGGVRRVRGEGVRGEGVRGEGVSGEGVRL